MQALNALSVPAFVGRKDNTQASPTGLFPSEKDSADMLLKLFAAITSMTSKNALMSFYLHALRLPRLLWIDGYRARLTS